jgi:monoterpene epsilon-lactone hydrolase
MWVAVSLAIAARLFRRLLLGPTMPSWSWRTDVTVALARAAITVAADLPDDPLINQFGRRIRAPVPIKMWGKVRVDRTKLGGLPVDRYVRLGDATDRATLLYFHGGGYVFGNPGTHRQHLSRLAYETGANAFAPQYRLAPAHRYPAAVEDAVVAYTALVSAGTKPERIIVSGDSAGGGLALALLLSIREQGLPMPGGAMLFSPYTDLTHSSYTITTNASTDYLPINELSHPNLFYADTEQLNEPKVSPVFADLTDLPPMLVFAGGAEMILDDSVRLVANARRDGVETEFIVEDEMMHVWPALVPWEDATQRTLDAADAWVENVVRMQHGEAPTV